MTRPTQTMTLMTAAAVLVLAAVGGMAQAKPALKDVTHVSEGLIAAGMAIELGDQCGDVAVRMIRGVSFLNGLKDHARSLGYTDAEIDAYVDDKVEKARLETVARGRLAALGAVPGDAATYCTVAQDQIAQGSQVGRLLR